MEMFFLRKLIELFYRTMKKITNKSRYEIVRQKPSTLNSF